MSTTHEPIEDAAEAGAWLESLINFEREPGFEYERMALGPIEALLERLGNPHRALSIIHVAGSKGKGSTCLLAESILRALGERVGTFTSPHLQRWTERFRIDAAEVPEPDLAAAVAEVRPHVEALREGPSETSPTFFDATTAVALLLFARAGVDRVLLEVGLGGRLDSTNVVSPAVCIITSIELEHTDKLGDTLAAIAGEKAGIIKPGVPCLVGALPEEAASVVEARCAALGAPRQTLGEALRLSASGSDGGYVLRFPGGVRFEFSLGALGPKQPENAALALGAIRALEAYDDPEMAEAARRGLSSVWLPGRAELISEEPLIIVDAAHTAASSSSLASVLRALDRGAYDFVLSISSDKDLSRIVDALTPLARRIYACRAEPIRSFAPEALADRLHALAGDVDVVCVASVDEAIERALDRAAEDVALCCTGSVYLAGAALAALEARGFNRRRPSPPPPVSP